MQKSDWGRMDPEEVKKMCSTQKQFEKEFGDYSVNININAENHIKIIISLKTVLNKSLFNVSNGDVYTYKQFICRACPAV